MSYELIDSKEKYQKFLLELKQQKEFALDTETTSMKPREADLLGIGFCWKEGEAYYVPMSHNAPFAPSYLKRGEGELFKQILENPNIIIIGHNIKYDFIVLKRFGINLQAKLFDTMIAAYLLNPGTRNFNLDGLTFTEFGFRKTPITNLIGEGRGQISMAEAPVEKVSDYCCEDADYTWRLKKKLEGSLAKLKLGKIFYEIEMPLIPALSLK